MTTAANTVTGGLMTTEIVGGTVPTSWWGWLTPYDWPSYPSYPSYPNWYVPVVYVPLTAEPSHCIGKAHVFECDHVPACKCGKVKRVMPRKERP